MGSIRGVSGGGSERIIYFITCIRVPDRVSPGSRSQEDEVEEGNRRTDVRSPETCTVMAHRYFFTVVGGVIVSRDTVHDMYVTEQIWSVMGCSIFVNRSGKIMSASLSLTLLIQGPVESPRTPV